MRQDELARRQEEERRQKEIAAREEEVRVEQARRQMQVQCCSNVVS
jgi:hypothetical protein